MQTGLVRNSYSSSPCSHVLLMQECAFLLFHQQQQQQQQQYSYSPSPGLFVPGSSSKPAPGQQGEQREQQGPEEQQWRESQAMDRLSAHPQETASTPTGSQSLRQRREQGERQGGGRGPRGQAARGAPWEEPAFRTPQQAFGEAPGAPEEDEAEGEGENEGAR